MSTRKISKQQFEDGVLIDTSGISRFVDDAVNHFNFIPPGTDKSSWIQQQAVFGYTERRFDWLVGADNDTVFREPPFMQAVNNNVANPTDGIRMKGVNSKSAAINVQAGSGGKYCRNGFIWQSSFWADRPLVVTDMDLFLQVDSNYISGTDAPYNKDWTWSTTGPVDTITSGSFVEDVVLQLEVDSPMNASQVDTSNVELHKSEFYLDGQLAMYDASWSSDMLPSMGNQAYGVCITARDINVPIAAKSRVRVNIFIPDWDTSSTVDVGDVRWMTQPYAPWRQQGYNLTLTWLERKT